MTSISGAVDSVPPEPTGNDDMRGALKAIAARANFPVLSANLLDEETGRLVDWPDVTPSALVEAAGVKVGIVGVMTAGALRATLEANVRGLRVTPLVPAIEREASQLRSDGADLVIVTAHAGGYCSRFDDLDDLSSCDTRSEIFNVARRLPPGLVDVIVAGHAHAGVAHRVEGIAITEAYSRGRAFGRVDVTVDRRTKQVADVHMFAPRELCARVVPGSETCGSTGDESAFLVPARYEGKTVSPDLDIVEAMAPSLQRVRDLQAIPLGVFFDTEVVRAGDLESPLGNLHADALRESMGADVSVHRNRRGGLRADLPVGPLTFGKFYDVFPFDNRLVALTLRAAGLARVFAAEIQRGRRGVLGVSGISVRVVCTADVLRVDLFRGSGRPVQEDELLLVATTDSLAQGSVFAPAAPRGGSRRRFRS